jgi:hypothetical protein
MKFTQEIPAYVIGLEQPEAERWQEVIAAEKRLAKRLVRAVKKDMAFPDNVLTRVVKWLVGKTYQVFAGRNIDEIDAWADALGQPRDDALLLQCSYGLSHLSELVDASSFWKPFAGFFGCTAGLRWLPGLGMVHSRNMDWAMNGMGQATRVFRFRRGRREFVSLGVIGFVGVFSGMLLRKYSVTMNWLPPTARPTFDFGPTFLIREILETCDTYEEAVYALKNTPLLTNASFLVCGVRQGQGCVIERTHQEAAVRRFRAPALVQANHFNARRLCRFNASLRDIDDTYEPDDETRYGYSVRRQNVLHEQLRRLNGNLTLKEIAGCLDVEPVLNEDTCQQMVLCPAQGTLVAWRRVS